MLLCAPCPGWQVGAVFPAASWAGTCCHAGLCVMSSERLMSHGSCGVIICLHLSVTGVSNGSVTVAPRRPAGGSGEASRALREPGAARSPCCPAPCSRAPALSLPVPSSLPPAVSPLSRGVSSQSRRLETLPANVSVCCLPGPRGKGLETQRGRSSGSEGKPLFLTARLLHFLVGKHAL